MPQYNFKKIAMLVALFSSVSSRADVESRHNFTSNALGNAIGFFNLEYSNKIADHLTLGVRGSTGKASFGDTDIRGSSYGVIARYYFKPALQDSSWYLAASADRENFDASVTSNSTVYTGASKRMLFAAGGGYHWFWDSFNVSLGLLFKSKQKIELRDAAGNAYKDPINTTISIDFTIGGKF